MRLAAAVAAAACAACAATDAAQAAGPAELLGPARGDRSCHPDARSRLCLGAHDVAADGRLVATAVETRRNVSRVAVHDRATRRTRTVATVRNGRVPFVDSVAVGGGLVVWAAHDVDSTAPIRLYARRLGAGGVPASRVRVVATTPGAYDDPELNESVSPSVSLAARGDGRVLAGWSAAGSARHHDRAGVVMLLDRLGRPAGPRRTITDPLAEDLSIVAVPDGFVAVWSRPRRSRHSDIRLRRLDPDGVPRGPATTLGTGDTPSAAARGFEVLVAWARARGDEIDVMTRRAGAAETHRVGILPGPAAAGEVTLAGHADGRWLLASAVHPDPYAPRADPSDDFGLARMYAMDLRSEGDAPAQPPQELAPRGTSGATGMAWLPDATLAWTSEAPTLAQLPRLAFSPLGRPGTG